MCGNTCERHCERTRDESAARANDRCGAERLGLVFGSSESAYLILVCYRESRVRVKRKCD
jgi:hypothetical protein